MGEKEWPVERVIEARGTVEQRFYFVMERRMGTVQEAHLGPGLVVQLQNCDSRVLGAERLVS